jgi:hypothetical protein
MPSIEDAPLRRAAADLIATVRRGVPIIELALHAVEQRLGTLTIETSIGPNGAPTTMVVFDDGGERKAVLLSLGSRDVSCG